ncbi:MAG: acetyl-CoA carboxylase biotin carboxyl carrier protein subunit [Spirochaetota bacterium]
MGEAGGTGDRVVTMEAMKMDIYVTAPVDGEVTSILCSHGDTTSEGAVLATVVPSDGGQAGAGLGEGTGPA